MRSRVLAIAGLVLAAACGDRGAEPGGAGVPEPAEHLQAVAPVWEAPTDIGPPASGRVVLRFGPELGDDAFVVEAPAAEVVAVAGRPVLRLGPGTHDQRLSVAVRGRFDPQEFSQVLVDAALVGRGDLRLRAWRGDELLAEGAPVGLPAGPELGTVTLDLPRQLVDGVSFDRLQLACEGGARQLDLTSLRLVEPSLAERVGGASLVELAGEARPAFPLMSDAPRVGRLALRPGQRLVVPVALPPLLRASERPAALRVERECDGVWTSLGEHALDVAVARWHELVIELPTPIGEAAAATSARLRLSLVGGSGSSPTACLLGPVRAWTPDEQAPLVLLITASDHRADHLALAFGGIDIDTPRLDALALRGVFFEDALAASNGERSALAALFTGRSPRDTRLLGRADRLVPAARTLAEVFAERGFRTEAALGARDAGPASGACQGFERVTLPTAERRPAAEVVADALALLSDRADRPTFLWVHLADARWPSLPAPEWLHVYYDEHDDPRFEKLRRPRIPVRLLPRELRDVHDLDWPRARLKAALTSMDAALEPLLAHPRVVGGWVAYAGLTGVLVGEHGIWFKHGALYPGVLAVPLVLAGPGVEAGRRDDRPVSTLSLGRTLLDLAGERATPFPGTDLLESAREASGPPRFAVAVDAAAVAVDDGEHLLVLNLRDTPEGLGLSPRLRGDRELFALRDDPLGEVDLIGDDAWHGVRRGLTERMLAWLGAAEDLGWAEQEAPGAEAVARLLDLGYLTVPKPASDAPFDLGALTSLDER